MSALGKGPTQSSGRDQDQEDGVSLGFNVDSNPIYRTVKHHLRHGVLLYLHAKHYFFSILYSVCFIDVCVAFSKLNCSRRNSTERLYTLFVTYDLCCFTQFMEKKKGVSSATVNHI